jgi:hypothetical protein
MENNNNNNNKFGKKKTLVILEGVGECWVWICETFGVRSFDIWKVRISNKTSFYKSPWNWGGTYVNFHVEHSNLFFLCIFLEVPMWVSTLVS